MRRRLAAALGTVDACRDVIRAIPHTTPGDKARLRALADEEARFSETLTQGMELLKKELGGVSGDVLPGDVAFKLYDTYGFPVDLTADVARELNMSVDQAGFDEAMEAQRARHADFLYGVEWQLAKANEDRDMSADALACLEEKR